VRMCGLRAGAAGSYESGSRARPTLDNAEAYRRATLDDPPASGPVYMMAEDSDVLPSLAWTYPANKVRSSSPTPRTTGNELTRSARAPPRN
jgi:hypothetical protein